MKIEHVALNVADPVGMAAWYCDHLGMTVAMKADEPPFVHFLADDSGDTMIEIYNNPDGDVPDYTRLNPSRFHLAFVSDNPDKDKARLLKAGATFVTDLHMRDGSYIIMMRDPWGTPIQFCKRGNPMLRMQKQS